MDNNDIIDRYDLARSLVGKTIIRFEVSTNREQIIFETDLGKVVWDTIGDCCSRSWIEEVDVPTGNVTKVEAIDMPESESATRHLDLFDFSSEESYKFYGVKIETGTGSGVIDFRNASNGWYGGAMVVIRDDGSE